MSDIVECVKALFEPHHPTKKLTWAMGKKTENVIKDARDVWFRAEALQRMQCVSEPDGTCRHIVCPRHHRLRNPLAYCPWERANGHARTTPGAEKLSESLEAKA